MVAVEHSSMVLRKTILEGTFGGGGGGGGEMINNHECVTLCKHIQLRHMCYIYI